MAKARTELIHCDNCGEDYAATYRRCPFCNAKRGQRQERYDEPEQEEYDDSRGGKRLSGGGDRRGGGDPARIALYVLAAAVILAIICFLISVVIPRLVAPAAPVPSAETSQEAEPSPSAAASALPSTEPSTEPSAAPSDSASEGGDQPDVSFHPLPAITGAEPMDDDPLALDSSYLPPVESDPVSAQSSTAPVTSQPPASQAPTASQAPAASQSPTASPAPGAGSLKLSSTDFTLSPRYPTYQMETGLGRAQTTYSIADETVATVNSTGLITAVGNGNTTLTVTDQSGHTATAIVRVSGMSSQSAASPAPSQAPAASQAPASGDAKLTAFGRTIDDFTINAQNPDPVTLKVQGGTASGWRSLNTAVATVSSGGTVTAVGNGTTTVECTLAEGGTLRCTVRVSGL